MPDRRYVPNPQCRGRTSRRSLCEGGDRAKREEGEGSNDKVLEREKVSIGSVVIAVAGGRSYSMDRAAVESGIKRPMNSYAQIDEGREEKRREEERREEEGQKKI